ncbi:hypothetical protein Tco_1457654 [Tanacetum coccineum]
MTLMSITINHSAFRSIFERENLYGSNYNDWFRSPKMVLRVEKKLFVIEQPISLAPPADSKYLCSGIRFMMLIMRLLVLRSEEEGKPVGPYIIKINNYVAQLEGLGYVLPQDLSVGLILNGLTNDFADFVRNYNKHNMRKTIGELHALLIEYENGLLSKGCYTTSNGDSRCGRAVELEDTSPSKNTSKIPMEVEGFEPPQDTSPSKNTSEILMSKCRSRGA